MSKCDCGCNEPDNTPEVVEITNEARVPVIFKVIIPTEAGDDVDVPPVTGKYRNTIVEYENNNHVYFYSSEGAWTLITTTRIDDYVISVNGKTGVVSLTAQDVKALPEDTKIPANTSDLVNDSGYVDSEGLAGELANAKADIAKEYATKEELGQATGDIPIKVSQLDNDLGFITTSALNEEKTARESEDTAIRNDMLKLKVSTTDPGEGSPLAANTLLGIYR